jgi:hypothetical protein
LKLRRVINKSIHI